MSKSKLSMKLTVLFFFGLAILLSRLFFTDPPAVSAPDKPAPTFSIRGVGAVQPRVSPEGKQVAFTYQGAIWRIPIDGGTMRRLTSGPGYAVEPAWSPDGQRIAYLHGRNWGNGPVKLMDAGTGKAIPIPQEEEILGSGPLYFTPDGNRLIGSIRTLKQLDALRALDLKTGKLSLIANMRTPHGPWAVSLDGKWIAMVTTMDVQEQQTGNDGAQTDLWKLPVSGGEPERIVRFPSRLHRIFWSHDGKSIYANTDLGVPYEDIWRIDLDDPERPTKITFGQADEDRPSVSADGKLLVYSDNREGAPALVVHDLKTGQARTLTIDRLDYAAPTGRLRLKLQDKANSKSAVARICLEQKDGGYPAPPGAIWRLYREFAHFYVRDQVEFEVPAGSYSLRAWHGPEYRVTALSFDVKPDAVNDQTIVLESWADPNGKGWYSGDNHIHANYGYGEYHNSPATMADMIAGESLNIGNFMVANSDSDTVFDRGFFRGRPDPLSTPRHVLYWNEEMRSTIWGHLTLVNLKQVVEPVFTGFKDTTNPYDIPSMSTISEYTRRQGGVVNYTHPASRIDDLYRGAYVAKGLPIYAPLGKIDTMDVMGSGDRPSTALFHRLLNCGIRITASAGTDVFLNRTRSWLPGGERVYVKVDGPLTYDKWIAGLKAGRSFVSNGPILEFSVDGLQIGDTLKLKDAGMVKVEASAASQYPLDRIEVLYNGQVVANGAPAKDAQAGLVLSELEKRIPLNRSGWLALRVSGPSVPDVKGEAVYAHTSPIYVSVAGKPAGSAEDARYLLQWIDKLWTTVQERDRIPGEQRKAEIAAEVEQARKYYQDIINREK